MWITCRCQIWTLQPSNQPELQHSDGLPGLPCSFKGVSDWGVQTACGEQTAAAQTRWTGRRGLRIILTTVQGCLNPIIYKPIWVQVHSFLDSLIQSTNADASLAWVLRTLWQNKQDSFSRRSVCRASRQVWTVSTSTLPQPSSWRTAQSCRHQEEEATEWEE